MRALEKHFPQELGRLGERASNDGKDNIIMKILISTHLHDTGFASSDRAEKSVGLTGFIRPCSRSRRLFSLNKH